MPEVAYDEVQAITNNRTTAPIVPSSISQDDSQKLGESSPIQYTEPKPEEPGLGQRVGEDVTKPFIQAEHSIGSGMTWLGNNLKDNTAWGGLGDRITRAGIVLRERSEANLSKNYSNFTPNILDDIVGAAPSLAAFMGTAAGATALGLPGMGIAVGATAIAGGASIAAESFNQFKDQGKSTNQANTLAAAIGVPVGGAMAAGFGIAGKITSPWLGKVLGDSINKIVSDRVVPGAAALAAQTATAGTLQLATGATPYQGKDSLVNLMADTAHAAVLGGVLGGATALPYVFKQHAAIIEGFRKLGLSPQDSQIQTDALLGQAGHVVMDKLEQGIKVTPEEQGRISVLPKTDRGPVQPNVLDRKGIPEDQFYPPANQEPLSADQVAQESAQNKYVKIEPMDISIKGTDEDALAKREKLTATDIRQQYMGNLDSQLARGAHLAEDMKTMAPGEMDAAFWGAHYTPEQIQKAIENPEALALEKQRAIYDKMESKEPFQVDKEELAKTVEEYKRLKPELEKALNLSEGGRSAIAESKLYYDEAGKVAQSFGTINEIKENYTSNRLYKPEPPANYLKVAGKGGLKQFSSHSLERFYDDPLMAIAGGKRFATTNLADLVAIHNQELAAVNHSRQLADAMNSLPGRPLGGWIPEGSLSKDWARVGQMKKDGVYLDANGEPQMRRQIFAAPKGIAKGLEPLVDPDWFRSKFPMVATIQQLQAYTKTGLLGLSVYHDITFATQTAASAGGIKTLADMPKAIIDGTMSTPAWRTKELDGLKHNLTTSITHEVQDIMSKMDVSANPIDKAVKQVLKVPVLKQLSEISEKHTEFLFGKYQRYVKVETWAKETANWEAAHPNATDEQLRQAKIGIAQATNAEFGGRNWEALGVNKTVQSLLRTFLLAPDWVMAMVDATKFAAQGTADLVANRFGKDFGGAAGIQARGTLYKVIAGSLAVTDILNYLRTGHHIWDNKKGHKMELEIAPDVYMSLVRGAPGELMKLVSNTIESGGPQGAQRYAEGKLSPFASSAMTAISGVNYYGSEIWKGDNPIQKTINGTWEIVSHDIPVPIGVTGGINYAQREQDKTPVGWASVATGAGRFSMPSQTAEKGQMRANVIHAFRNNNEEYVNGLIAKGDLSEEQADKYREESQKSDMELKTEHMKIDKMIDLYKKSNENDRSEMKDLLDEKYDRFQNSKASPNEKKRMEKLYNSVAKTSS